MGVVEVQDQACGSWSGKNGTQLLLAILIGRARARVVTASSSHEKGKTGVPSTLSATPAVSDEPSTCQAFHNLNKKHWGSGDNPRVCDWCDADTCDSPSISVPNEGAESLTKREFHFFVLEFDVCCQLLYY